jgi:hypothetical protein
VVVNFDYKKTKHVEVNLKGKESQLLYATPDVPDHREFTGLVGIPPNSAVIIMEK